MKMDTERSMESRGNDRTRWQRGRIMNKQAARVRLELPDTHPRVWRRIDIPLSYTLWSLHELIEVAFDWEGFQHWGFYLRPSDERRLGSKFRSGWGPAGAADPQGVDLRTFSDWNIKKFHYVYDYRDCWEHTITIMRVFDADPRVVYPHVVAGRGFPPLEDMGGARGYYEFVDAAADPKHPSREQFLEQFEESYMNEFDPDYFDKEDLQQQLHHFLE